MGRSLIDNSFLGQWLRCVGVILYQYLDGETADQQIESGYNCLRD